MKPIQPNQRIALLLLLPLLLPLQQCGLKKVGEKPHPITSFKTQSGIEMIIVPGSSFMMGSENGNADEQPVHPVTVDGFAMDKFEVTQDIYEQLMMADPSHFKDAKRPVEQVRWSDGAMFCNARSELEGLESCYNLDTYECNFNATGYRLPTEAEWEYACRAGTSTVYDFGVDPQKLGTYAWYAANSNNKTSIVGTKKPNQWGLCDMYGNVMEWVHDVYDENYYENSPENNPRGPAEGKKRVLRGGAWNSGPDACRPSYRMADVPGITDACFARDTYGFRCVRRLSDNEIQSVTTNEG